MSNPPDNPDSGPFNLGEYITRKELLTRRARMLRELANIYKDEYWALMEEIKDKYAEFCWEYGKATIDDSDEDVEIDKNVERENVAVADGVEKKAGKPVGVPGSGNRCEAYRCERKAMELTQYCFDHILLDERQVLYKGCKYVLRGSLVGPILCNKPILSVAVPSLCTAHKQRTEKHVAKALKKAGLSSHSASKSAPQFHAIVAEFVNQIQAKRRAAREVKKDPCEMNEEDDMTVHID
ncbi:hypothetical protein ACET3Z_009110 [Daucus carota]